jgi:signal transduction histidine kinase
MSRIENKKLTIEEELVDVEDFKQGCLISIKELVDSKDIDFSVEDNGTSKYLYFDKVHVQEIFMNLASNAIKYTPEGGYVKVITNESYDEKNDIFVDYSGLFDLVFFEVEYDWVHPFFKAQHFSKALQILEHTTPAVKGKELIDIVSVI